MTVCSMTSYEGFEFFFAFAFLLGLWVAPELATAVDSSLRYGRC